VYLVLGYLGYDNYGDELLASLVTQKLKEIHGSKTNVRYLSSKSSPLEHLSSLLKSKKVFAIGGMFQDLSSPWSVYYYFFVLLLAKILKKKIIFFAQGIGPLQTKATQFITRLSLRLANEISVRDPESSEILNQFQINHKLVSDWAWILMDEIDNIDTKKFPSLKPHLKYICVVLRESKFLTEDFLKNLAQEIDKDSHGVIFLEFQQGDQSINIKLKSHLKATRDEVFMQAKDFSAQELIYFFRNSVSTIYSMRYHAGIIAKLAQIEVNLINCDPKMLSLAKQISLKSIEELFTLAKTNEEYL
jgi:polysaccharide pyruvyl transferase CsaB